MAPDPALPAAPHLDKSMLDSVTLERFITQMESSHRLAAIMFTDIVGYTSLMGVDQESALAMLNRNRAIHKSTISRHNGEWLKEMGDGTLASFHTSSEAVRCAGAIQREAVKANVPLRIGIHMGEVVFEGQDVFGDGVNIASRIEQMSEKGQILASDVVYQNIKNKSGIEASFLGEKILKNVDDPVRLYTIEVDQKEGTETLSTEVGTHNSKNSIAVLPFVNISSDAEQEYFGDGLTEEVIADLSQLSNLLVISRSSVMTFKGTTKNLKRIANELNVKYVLEGSVRKAGNNLRITAQLINAESDVHLWAEKYNGSINDIFEIQENVSRSIVEAS